MTSTARHLGQGWRWWLVSGLGLGLCLPLGACSWRAPQPKAQTAKPVQGGVTFSDVVLAQTDEKGKVLWRFQAKGVTSNDQQQQVTATHLKGQLYEGGKPLFDVVAERGTLFQTSQQMRLQGKIQVLDRQRRLQFRGREAQWDPQKGVLTVRDRLTVTHPQLQLQANQLEASRQGRWVTVTGNVVMQTRSNRPRPLQLNANQALWKVDEQSFQAGVATEGEQQPTVKVTYGPEKNQTTALAGEAQANLKTGLVTLRRPVQLSTGTLTLTSRELLWDTIAQRISTQALLQIQDPRRQVTILANRGALEQQQNLVKLEGNVEVTRKDRARLTSDRLLWNTSTEQIEALGNVNYAQASPVFNLKGEKAVGKLESQTLQISGGDVVTEIIPQ